MKFNYIYGKQAEQYDYLYIPKAFMKEELFKSMTASAKIMYAVLMEKQQISVEMGWIDTLDHVFIMVNAAAIGAELNWDKLEVVAAVEELERFGVLEIAEKECFRGLSNDAKTLYALMLDRMSLSLANEWLDEDGKVYINYSLEDIMNTLNCGKTKAVALLKELDSESGIGLIEKKNMGIARASVFYVMNFVCEEEISEEEVCSESMEVDNEAVDNSVSRVQKTNPEDTAVFENRTHACPENEHGRVQNLNPNKTNMSKTISSINHNQHEIDEMEGYSEIIKENIDYDSLLLAYPYDQEMVEGIYDLILETVLSKNQEICIAGDVYPKNLVKKQIFEA